MTGGSPRPSALERWSEIEGRLAGRTPALFLDYDGTLSPIAARPELATLPEATREVLRRLAARFPVAVLSGRGREDVAALVGLPELTYAGSHGFDIAGPTLRHEVGAELPAVIESAAALLQEELGGIPGVLVEPKRFAAAVHYRLAPEALPRVETAVEAALAAHPELRRAPGKKVIELRPRLDWDKGRALLWLLAALAPGAGAAVVPLYLGDDATDEDAFRAVAGSGIGGIGGIGIVVADPAEPPRPTAAAYSLRDPAEVRAFLERLAAL